MPVRTDHLLHTTPKNADAVNASLAAACRGLRFSLAEIWKKESEAESNDEVRFSFVWKYITPHMEDGGNPLGLQEGEEAATTTTNWTSQDEAHKLSPQLCARAFKEKTPLWYTSAEPGTPLHPNIPVNTAVVLPIFSFETQQEFYILLFAHDKMESSSAKLAYLRFIAKAAVTASSIAFSSPVPPPLVPSVPSTGEQINTVNVVCAQPELPSGYLQWTDLKNVEFLVEGGASIIYTADYQHNRVIAKILREDLQRSDMHIKEMKAEIELLQSLHHPGIAKFYGGGLEPRPFIVMELLEGGTLNQRLGFAAKYSGSTKHGFQFKSIKKPFTFPALLKCAYELADALRYLHDEAIPGFAMLHRDLKPDNIGFKADGTVKLFDFGLAKALPKDARERLSYHMTGETGSIRYMAPEVALKRPYDESVDVYSYSFVVWEMATMTKPFEGLNRAQFYERVIHGGERPQINRRWPREFIALLRCCWQTDPADRPSYMVGDTLLRVFCLGSVYRNNGQTFSEVLEVLQGLIAQHEEEPRAQQRWGLLTDRKSSWF